MFYLIELFFFFKQKTAYEMRISDWSSDVCSSDLPLDVVDRGVPGQLEDEDVAPLRRLTEDAALEQRRPEGQALMAVAIGELGNEQIIAEIGSASCRDRVWQAV